MPFVGRVGRGKHKQHTLYKGFHTVINADKVTVTDRPAENQPVVIDQAVGAALGLIGSLVLNDPSVRFADKAAMLGGDQRRGQHDIIVLSPAKGYGAFSKAIQIDGAGLERSVKNGNLRTTSLRNPPDKMSGFVQFIHMPILPLV